MEKKFLNGFKTWMETFYEVVATISRETGSEVDTKSRVIKERYEAGGSCAMYSLAEELTDEFEKKNEGREWDGEFLDEVDEFLNEKLFTEK